MTYAARVEQLIDEGLDRGDAQSVADAEHKGGRAFAFNPDFPNDPHGLTTLQAFPTSLQARAFRARCGSGGWIFEPQEPGESILFPPDMTPFAIFNHPITKGRTGRLIGSA